VLVNGWLFQEFLSDTIMVYGIQVQNDNVINPGFLSFSRVSDNFSFVRVYLKLE
jgi:hypothetical protein